MQLKLSIKLIMFFVAFPLLFFSQCKKVDVPKDTPKCIKKEIRKNEKNYCPGSTVDQYNFQGKTVYVFNTMDCADDGESTVMDENCHTICKLGGWNGNLLCDGVDFYANAVYEKKIWKKD